MQFNKQCYVFQKRIIDIFNKEENIPFLLKYYLFKDIWESIQQNKFFIDRDNRIDETEQKTISTSIDLPDEFFQSNQQEENQ